MEKEGKEDTEREVAWEEEQESWGETNASDLPCDRLWAGAEAENLRQEIHPPGSSVSAKGRALPPSLPSVLCVLGSARCFLLPNMAGGTQMAAV